MGDQQCGGRVNSYLEPQLPQLEPPSLPCLLCHSHNELYLQTLSQKKPFLPYIASVGHFVVAANARKVTNPKEGGWNSLNFF